MAVPGAEQVYRPATVVDISRSGYRILSGADLAQGTEVIITLNAVAIFGSVRHSERYDDDTYTTGVQISHVSAEPEESGLPACGQLQEV